ncbi:PH domain-containing protein [Actinomadura sp. BRA 177]|nr:PH domain-containing protein [Actinomadura sp. BRA 177]
MTIHSGQEQIIWEGESRNVTARATGGRFTLHYRLTTHYLYFETGGIAGTRQEQIPLINIQDVDVSQTLLQKTQRVGNVLVHIVRPGGPRETAVLDSIVEPAQVRDLINRTVHHVRAAYISGSSTSSGISVRTGSSTPDPCRSRPLVSTPADTPQRRHCRSRILCGRRPRFRPPHLKMSWPCSSSSANSATPVSSPTKSSKPRRRTYSTGSRQATPVSG